jgi:hypothetical protein
MIVSGDAHKRSHAVAAVSPTTGELVGEQTVQVGARGFAAVLVRARGPGDERVGHRRTAGMSRDCLSGF